MEIEKCSKRPWIRVKLTGYQFWYFLTLIRNNNFSTICPSNPERIQNSHDFILSILLCIASENVAVNDLLRMRSTLMHQLSLLVEIALKNQVDNATYHLLRAQNEFQKTFRLDVLRILCCFSSLKLSHVNQNCRNKFTPSSNLNNGSFPNFCGLLVFRMEKQNLIADDKSDLDFPNFMN